MHLQPISQPARKVLLWQPENACSHGHPTPILKCVIEESTSLTGSDLVNVMQDRDVWNGGSSYCHQLELDDLPGRQAGTETWWLVNVGENIIEVV